MIRGTRFVFMAYGNTQLCSVTSSDIYYNTLPMFHTTGGIAGPGASIFSCSTLVFRKKFSASKFFEDCSKYKCTIFNYIGEICRYLLAQPVRSFDKSHNIKKCYGSGLRPSIWQEFQTRFNIPSVCEIYGAAEGNATIANIFGKVGAVGFSSVVFPFVFPMAIVKRDEETGIEFLISLLLLLFICARKKV